MDAQADLSLFAGRTGYFFVLSCCSSYLAHLNNVQKEQLYWLASVLAFANVSNPLMDLVPVWYDDRYLSKILCSTIPTPLHDLEVKVTEFLY